MMYRKVTSVPLSGMVLTHAVGCLLVLAALLPALAGCDLADPIKEADAFRAESTGGLRVLLTDAPFPFHLAEEANVTITRVVLHSKNGTRITLSDETQTFNLLKLQDGAKKLLAKSDDLSAGPYDEIRLKVSDASVMLINGARFDDFRVPSETIQVRLKDFEVEVGQVASITLDFDVAESFIVEINTVALLDAPLDIGDIKGFKFDPVVRQLGVNYEAYE